MAKIKRNEKGQFVKGSKLTTHGATTNGNWTKLYQIWSNIKARCNNQNQADYQYYGGRGISICEEWEESFVSFRNWARENGFKENLEIDRIDNSGDYCPENCRFVTRSENIKNSRLGRKLTLKGETKNITDWAEETNIPRRVIQSRIDRLGWSVEKALTTPLNSDRHYITYNGETKYLSEWAREKNIKPSTILKRLKLGWSTEKALTTPVRGSK